MTLSARGICSRIIIYLQLISCIFIILVQCFSLVCCHGRNRKNNLLYFEFPQSGKCCFIFRPYRNSVNFSSHLRLTCINETAWYIGRAFVIQKFFCKADSYTSGTDNCNLYLLDFFDIFRFHTSNNI